MVSPTVRMEPMGIGESAKQSVIEPPAIVYQTVVGIGTLIKQVFTGKASKAEVSGPIGIVKETAEQAKRGPAWLLYWLGALSAYLGAFNLMPFPALDGGRLMFLGVEAVSRRRPDAKVEARVHALGLLVLLSVIALVTFFDIRAR
jgi:regulator of sigma E protease